VLLVKDVYDTVCHCEYNDDQYHPSLQFSCCFFYSCLTKMCDSCCMQLSIYYGTNHQCPDYQGVCHEDPYYSWVVELKAGAKALIELSMRFHARVLNSVCTCLVSNATNRKKHFSVCYEYCIVSIQ